MMNKNFLLSLTCGLLLSSAAAYAAGPNGETDINDLADETLSHIGSFLPAKSLSDLGETCHRLNNISKDEFLWKEKINSEFSSNINRVANELNKDPGQSFSFKKFYQDQIQNPILYVFENRAKQEAIKLEIVYTYGLTRFAGGMGGEYMHGYFDLCTENDALHDSLGNSIHILRKSKFLKGFPHGISIEMRSFGGLEILDFINVDGYSGLSLAKDQSTIRSIQKSYPQPYSHVVFKIDKASDEASDEVIVKTVIYEDYLRQ